MVAVKVLLAEEDEDDYRLTRDLLVDSEATYAVDWARSYDEALLKIAHERYDVLLLDYRLGARTGLDLLREAAKRGSAVPVLLLIGQGDRGLDLKAAELGACDYLSKQEVGRCPTLLERAIRYAITTEQHQKQRLQLALAHEAQRQAEDANRAKDEFIAMVSHELRNPLNAMMAWVAVLQVPNIDSATAAKALKAIERSAKRQMHLLEDLLDITGMIQGTLRIEKRPVELAAVVEAAVDAVRPSAEAKSIVLDVTSDPALGLVAADPERLQQIVVNLLSNSIKFTPEEGRIEIGLERVQDGAEPQAQLTVKDTGAGIDPGFLPHVFDRYSQSPDLSSGKRRGLGLRLAIVRCLVELHGGKVRAESPGEGLGATFTLRLPLTTTVSERLSPP